MTFIPYHYPNHESGLNDLWQVALLSLKRAKWWGLIFMAWYLQWKKFHLKKINDKMINDNSYCLLMKKKQRQEITNFRKIPFDQNI